MTSSTRWRGGNSLISQRFLGTLLLRAESHLGGRLMVVEEESADALNFDLSDRPSDLLYAHLLGIDKVEVVLYFKFVEEGVWEIGFRSSHFSAIDVGAISATLNGGGHRKAAGATVEKDLEELKTLLVNQIEKEFNKT